jgi:hypothetical protein
MVIYIDDASAFITCILHDEGVAKYRTTFSSSVPKMSQTIPPTCKRSDTAIRDAAVDLMSRAVRRAAGLPIAPR